MTKVPVCELAKELDYGNEEMIRQINEIIGPGVAANRLTVLSRDEAQFVRSKLRRRQGIRANNRRSNEQVISNNSVDPEKPLSSPESSRLALLKTLRRRRRELQESGVEEGPGPGKNNENPHDRVITLISEFEEKRLGLQQSVVEKRLKVLEENREQLE